MGIKEHLEVLLAPLLEEYDCFLIDITIKPSKLSQKVTILADTDAGITIQECTSISRRLAKQLEENELFTAAYTLEVSSPGLDQPLVLPRQYKKNIGRNLKISLKSGESLVGTLTDVTESGILIKLPAPKKKSKIALDESLLNREIAFEDLSKALIEISFK